MLKTILQRIDPHYLYALIICTVYAFLNFVDGRGGVAELQPLVLRFMDSGYLEYDFFVNSSDIYNARFYIVKYLSIFAHFFGIDYGMHIAGIFSFVTTLFFIYLIAFKITNSALTSFVVLLLSMMPRNMGIDLGEWYLVSNQIGAGQLVMPLILGSLYFILSEKNIVALIVFIPLSLLHPLLGLEMFTLFVLYIALYEKQIKIKSIVVLTFLLIVVNYMIELSTISEMFYLDATSLKKILVDYRHPHHYLVFNSGFLGPALFLTLLLMAWKIMQSWSHISMRFINIFLFIMLPLSALSIIFIDYYPLRIAMTAIPFRLLSVIGYMIIILAFGMIVSRVLNLNAVNVSFLHLTSGYHYHLLIIVFIFSSIIALVNIQHKRLLILNNVINNMIPIDLNYISIVNFSKEIERLTEKDSIIITPLSEIKHLSNRATFEGAQFPFVDKYMHEWYERRKDLSLSVDDSGLSIIKERYSLNTPIYALIDLNRKTKFTSLYCNQTLCLIKL